MPSETGQATKSIINQYETTFRLLRRSIECFNAEQWINGIPPFEVPCKVAYHTLQCLVYYFRDDPEKGYREIPTKFGKDWWGIPDDELPNQSMMLEFLNEVSESVIAYLSALKDEDLGRQFHGQTTIMRNIMYAMRHTMHHQGGLNVLSVHHGIDVDLWDS